MVDLDKLSWPVAKLGEALNALARRSGLSPHSVEVPRPPASLEQQTDDDALSRWIVAAAGCLGIETEPVGARYHQVEQLVRGAGPALLRLRGEGGLCFLLLLRGGRRTVRVLGPDLAVHRLRTDVVRAALCHRVEAPLVPQVDRLLDEAGVPRRRQQQARAAILRQRLASVQLGGCWLLRLAPGASIWRQARLAGLLQHLLAIVAVHAVLYTLLSLSWWLIGRGVFAGRLERGWLFAWALLLLSLIPFRLLRIWWENLFATGMGALLKRRLLYGALRLEPDEIRHQGVGQLLGRVIESEAVETLALSGGLYGLVATIELVVAAVILGVGAGGVRHALLLLGWTLLTFLITWWYFRSRSRWTSVRLEMTHDLVERMVGHRTRLAQEPSERWHDEEDQDLAHYLEQSRVMDRSATWLVALVPRGWLVLGLFTLFPAFISGRASPAALAISLGGVLLAYQALARKLSMGLQHIADAWVAWQQTASLFHAAARPEVMGSPTFALASGPATAAAGDKQSVLDAHDLIFRYRDRTEPVLRNCALRIHAGDRLLLEGPSGGGKSTLAALLIGLRQPESGLLLLQGLDRPTLGAEGWRRRVAAAPQFHENFVLTETFLFNLLMGRGWPPRMEDVAKAKTICHELGLGDLIGRMPAGLLQMVGESGWRLSHGERSRLYIARALLQGADLVVLDESFAALDPENLQRALHCVLDRAPALLVIAHP